MSKELTAQELDALYVEVVKLQTNFSKYDAAVRSAKAKWDKAKNKREEAAAKMEKLAANLPDGIRNALLGKQGAVTPKTDKARTQDWLRSKLADGAVSKDELMRAYRDEGIGQRLILRHHADIAKVKGDRVEAV
jgi:hypothetical protein